jgi:hypothetical protein
MRFLQKYHNYHWIFKRGSYNSKRPSALQVAFAKSKGTPSFGGFLLIMKEDAGMEYTTLKKRLDFDDRDICRLSRVNTRQATQTQYRAMSMHLQTLAALLERQQRPP